MLNKEEAEILAAWIGTAVGILAFWWLFIYVTVSAIKAVLR